jgi:hypothetical protein
MRGGMRFSRGSLRVLLWLIDEVGCLLIRSLAVVPVLECEYHKLSSPTPLSLPLRRRALSATTATTTTTITKTTTAHPPSTPHWPHVPHTFPCSPPSPSSGSYPVGAEMVGRWGTTILSTPPINSARTRAMSRSYPKLRRAGRR